MDVTIEGV
jgi:hypothetical protein